MLNPNLLQPFDRETVGDTCPIFILTAAQCRSGDGTNADAPSKTENNAAAEDYPEAVPSALRALAALNGFSGKAGVILRSEEGVLVGAGAGTDDFIVAAAASSLSAGSYHIAFPDLSGHERERTLLGWLLGGYRFTRYKKESEPRAILMAPQGVNVERIRHTASAMSKVRDLVNTPAGDMLPSQLEAEAANLTKKHGATLSVMTGDDLLTQGFPMVHAVGRASADAPRLIDILWPNNPHKDDIKKPLIAIVGKGVCFDSGGLNIKGAGGMGLMKKDMGGAAHALGLAQLIMDSDLPVRLRVLIPAVENAIDGSAFRPGDILQTRKGLTVEIGNTDAEGRLILGDAMTYACEQETDLLITLATLTGAARVALGPEVIPFYTDDVDLAHAMKEASADTQDPAWHMPMWPNYEKMLASSVADMNNISGNSFAGSIIAALFLRRFIPAGQRWLHFDLYAWRPSGEPGRPQGGEAQCLRALFTLIERLQKS